MLRHQCGITRYVSKFAIERTAQEKTYPLPWECLWFGVLLLNCKVSFQYPPDWETYSDAPNALSPEVEPEKSLIVSLIPRMSAKAASDSRETSAHAFPSNN